MAESPRRILFLDAYDSFSNNITALLTTLLDVDVFVLPIDSPLLDPTSPKFEDEFRTELAHYDAVVCGPGPGSPENERDIGLMKHVWTLRDRDLLPVLGVCLGFQSLAISCGAKIRRLRRGLHGMVRDIEHQADLVPGVQGNVFTGVGNFEATLYHSLCVDIGQDIIPEVDWTPWRWSPSSECPDILPLAWSREKREDGMERVLMAMKHRWKPFWGVQYHPESVCTHEEGNLVIRNWFHDAIRWNREHSRTISTGDDMLAANARKPSLLSQLSSRRDASKSASTERSWWTTFAADFDLISKTVHMPDQVQIPDLVELLDVRETEQIVLDSANAAASLGNGTGSDVRGRYSIIALDVTESLRLEYHVGDGFATARLPSIMGMPVSLTETISLANYKSIWQLIAEFQDARRLEPDGPHDSPFLGGFMGYITYEQGLSGIGVELAEDRGHNRPDVCLVWVTKSLVIDHAKKLLHIQQLGLRGSQDDSFVENTVSKLEASHLWQHSSCGRPDGYQRKRDAAPPKSLPRTSFSNGETQIRPPNPGGYEAKVQLCQEYIAAGESYELCLTDQTTIARRTGEYQMMTNSFINGALPSKRRNSCRLPGSWQLYNTLRSRQPAPFASYLRLGGATLVSASPERFLQYGCDGLCSMRPMKGTVRKSEAVSTLAQAETILHVPKEEAENLMIVDLVRHDLHGICGPGSVSVPHLMKVEEYQSVFQMITVVEGQLPRPNAGEDHGRYTGLDVLAASLPPGSMTGAPKKRSCEILQQIEQHKERSLYSGVVGYMDVAGRGDWSVTIRSMFRWDDEQEGSDRDDDSAEVWHIGAGGAVTILSTAQGEREEMFTKLAGPLGVFSESG